MCLQPAAGHHHQEGRAAPHGPDDEPGPRVHHVQLAAGAAPKPLPPPVRQVPILSSVYTRVPHPVLSSEILGVVFFLRFHVLATILRS